MDFGESLTRFINENKEELYRTHRELCLIPAPSGFEDERAAYCKRFLENVGAEGVFIDSAKNVIFPYCCEGSDRITVISAHTDTVFPMETKLEYVDDGEWIHCPGAGDDTENLLVLLFSVKYLLQEGYRPKHGILFVCNSCEEGLGNLKGVKQVFRDYAGRIARMAPVDAGLYRISTRVVGSHRYEVTVKTAGGHSFHAFGTPNAINEAARIISEIYRVEVPTAENSHTTYNVGTIFGGTSVNSIAQDVKFLCEYRSDSVECLEIMKEKFERIFANAGREGVDVSVELIGNRPCAKGVDENEILRMAEACRPIYERVTGVAMTYGSASTDCNIPQSMGIPAICIGAGRGQGAHTLEEKVLKDAILQGMRILPEVIVTLAGLEE